MEHGADMKSGEGFGFLEVVIALAVMALMMSSLFSLALSLLHAARWSCDAVHAPLAAQSFLAAHPSIAEQADIKSDEPVPKVPVEHQKVRVMPVPVEDPLLARCRSLQWFVVSVAGTQNQARETSFIVAEYKPAAATKETQ
jgi:hypothetical protein